MPGRLLESAGRPRRSLRTTISSLVVHAALIVLAIRATAGAASAVFDQEVTVHVPLPTPDPQNQPSQQSSGGAPTTSAKPQMSSLPAAPSFSTAIATDIPPIPNLGILLDETLRAAAGIATRGSFGDGVHAGPGFGKGPGDGRGSNVDGGPFTDAQVDRQAYMVPGTMAPKYPESLRTLGIQGDVVAQFIVDTTQRVEPKSIVILSSPSDFFSAAVRAALRTGRFVPAESNGRKVRQLVQQTFTFTLH